VGEYVLHLVDKSDGAVRDAGSSGDVRWPQPDRVVPPLVERLLARLDALESDLRALLADGDGDRLRRQLPTYTRDLLNRLTAAPDEPARTPDPTPAEPTRPVPEEAVSEPVGPESEVAVSEAARPVSEEVAAEAARPESEQVAARGEIGSGRGNAPAAENVVRAPAGEQVVPDVAAGREVAGAEPVVLDVPAGTERPAAPDSRPAPDSGPVPAAASGPVSVSGEAGTGGDPGRVSGSARVPASAGLAPGELHDPRLRLPGRDQRGYP